MDECFLKMKSIKVIGICLAAFYPLAKLQMEAALGTLYNKRSHLNKSLTFSVEMYFNFLEMLTCILFVKHCTAAFNSVNHKVQWCRQPHANFRLLA